MKVIVCDASPLIFLAKLNRLHLISDVLQGRVSVLKCVVDEVSSENAGVTETKRLGAFLDSVEIVDFQAPEWSSKALSQSDQSTLTWAIEHRADWLVADERLLRRVAREEGISTVGFLGILVEAARQELLLPTEAKEAIDESISRHGCRISVDLYRRILSELNGL